MSDQQFTTTAADLKVKEGGDHPCWEMLHGAKNHIEDEFQSFKY